MTFRVFGLEDFQDQLDEWHDDLDDVSFTKAKQRAVLRGRDELIEEIKDNISNIPHNLQELRQSWRYAQSGHGDVSIWTEKDYAPVFEYGAAPYDIRGNPLAFPASEWDNPLAKQRFGLSDGDTAFFQKVRHPGFNAYFYFTNAFLEMAETGRFEEIVAEELVDKELARAFE